MKSNNLAHVSKQHFRRLVGVKRATFAKMVELVRDAHKEKKRRGGHPNKLSIEDMVLMTFEYLREYRTYAAIGAIFGLSESNAYENIRWVESILVNSKEFSLPGKKALLKGDNSFEIVLIDVTESPIERPKKTSVASSPAKRKGIRSKHK